MGPVTVINTAFASIALFTCLLQLFLSLKKKGDILTLISAVLSLVVFFRYSLIFICSGPLAIAEHHLTIWRCQLILTQLVTICMLAVIFRLLKDDRKFIIFLHVLIISLLAILGLIMPDALLFGNNELIYLNNVSNADNIPMIDHGFSWWRVITNITILLFVFSALMLLVRKLNSANRKKINVLITGSVIVLFTAFYDQMVDLGVIHSTYLLPFGVFLLYMILNFIPFLYLLEEVAESNLLSQQEKKWRNLVFEADVIVVSLNRMGHIEFINPFFLELTGYREDEVLGKDWFEFFIPPKEFYTTQGAFIETLEFKFHPQYINPILTKSKEERIIRWYNVSTHDNNNNITGSLSIGMDITEDLRDKEDLSDKLKLAQELIDKLKNK